MEVPWLVSCYFCQPVLAGYEFARSQINKNLTQAEEDFYNEFQPWLQHKLSSDSYLSLQELLSAVR